MNKVTDFKGIEVRALSWKEPYASLMLHGKIETRTWNTSYRGPVLICASKKSYQRNEVLVISGQMRLVRIGGVLGVNQVGFPRAGHAIAIGNLVDSRPMQIEDEYKCFVKFHSGLWCHVYENVQPIEPFPWKGSQGWKKLTEEQKSLIKIIQP